MHVSLMVSGQRRDRDGPLSSSRGAWLCTVSTTGSRGQGDRGHTGGPEFKGQGARKTQELMKKGQK